MDTEAVQEPAKERQTAAGAVAVAAGLLGTLGWALHVPRLAAILADGASMKLNTALALVALGLALAVPRLRVPLAAFAALVAGLSFAEFALGRDLGIDQTLVRDLVTPPDQSPGRTSPSTALALLLVAGAILGRRNALAPWAAIGAFLVSADAVVIHAYALGLSGADTGMALQTGFGVLAASVGAASLALGLGPLAVFASPHQGGRLTRRVLAPLAAALVAIGWLAARGASGMGLRPGLWIAGQTIATCTTFGVAAWWYARGLNREDERREAAQRELREANAGLERRVAERTAELAAANGEMEAFVHAIGHDIRAPIRTLAANAAMVLEDAGDVLDDSSAELLRRSAARAKGLGVLVDDLLRYTRVSGAVPRTEPLDLTALARSVAAELDEGSDGRVVVEEGLAASADPSLMRLVLLNLMGNALKFSPQGGEVSVGRTDEGAFFVRDQGVGFDAEQAEAVFEPLKRLVRESDFPGSGMGLANVRRAIERQGGRAWAESATGKGATFFFTLG